MTSTAFSLLLAAATLAVPAAAFAGEDSPVPTISPKVEADVRAAYARLIDAENAHDLPAVRKLFVESPNALFVAKTRTAEEGNWAGFWSTDTAVSHIGDLFGGVFTITPDFTRERATLLASGVAQTYVPVQIAVGYAGQSGTPKPFLMILDWVRVGGQWKVITDIALPVPPSPPAHS